MNRKQRRAREAQIRKDGNDELAAQVAMFGKLPEECTACEIPFDKKNKEMATTWNVVVRARLAGIQPRKLSIIT
jgi:cytidylate kinase